MIELLAAIALQSSIRDEAPTLLLQSATRVIDSYGDMAEALGECSSVYPGGVAHPYVVRARQDVAEIGWDTLTTQTERVESILYAEASARPVPAGVSAISCSERIEDAAIQVSQHASGLEGLLRTLRQTTP